MRPPLLPRHAGLLAALALALTASRSGAQTNYEPRDLTRGVAIPGVGIGGDHDASAVALNPGGLSTLTAPSVSFAYSRLASDETRMGNAGWALSLAVPLLRLPGSGFAVVYGFGYQSLDSPDTWVGPVPGGERQDGSYLLSSASMGTPELSVGYTVGSFFWTDTPQSESILTHHLGVSSRPSRFYALGVALRDIFEPVGRAAEEKFRRSIETEIMLRPLGDWRLELGGGARSGEDDLDDFFGRAQIRLFDGVAVFGRYASIERHFGDPAAPASRDNRVTFGITIDGIDSLVSNRPRIGLSVASSMSSLGPDPYAATSGVVRWSAEKYPPIIEKKHVEQIAIAGDIDDREFVDLLAQLRRLATNDDVAGALFDIDASSLGWGRTEELRDAIAKLHAAGKDSVAYLRDGGTRSYYLASVCTRVVVHPTASIAVTGVATRLFYIRELLDKLGIAAQILKIGDFKSAPEALSEESPSQPSREQIHAYQADIVGHAVEGIAASRGISTEGVRKLFETPTLTPPAALEAGLVDGVLHPDQVLGAVRTHFGDDVRVDTTSSVARRPKQWAYPQIAVVHVEGAIIPGRATPGFFGAVAGGEDIADAIKEAREDGRVEAIILRVNSGGGAVMPSERIAREVELTRGKKPIIVSMGDVAASGGYMVAAYGDRIVAPATTLTGSIGIFAIRFSIAELLDKIGIKTTAIREGEHADQDHLSRPWTEKEKQATFDHISYLYGRFVSIVASGRGMATAQVEPLAGGRIYSGVQAKAKGLVDDNGSFLDALALARDAADISDGTQIQIVHLPTLDTNLVARLLGVQADTMEALAQKLPPALRASLRAIPDVLWTGGGYMARLPFVELSDQ